MEKSDSIIIIPTYNEKENIDNESIPKEGKYKINPDVNIPFNHGMHLVVLGETEKMAKVFK